MSHNPMRGYTLIELLITISITAVLITFGVNAYRKSSDLQAVKSQTELLITTLTQAQKAATTGKTDCTSRYLGERVRTTSGSATMTITSTCSDDLGNDRTITLSNMTFAVTTDFTFKPLNLGIDLGLSNSLNLDYRNSSDTYRIEITKSGSIKSMGKI